MLADDPNDPRLKQGSDAGQNPVRQSYKHKTCGGVTQMALRIAETYARDPKFYGATFCCVCGTHLPVEQFTWITPDGRDTAEAVGS